ncbi:MAG: tryptophan synthase subunit alpha [Hyphomonadaceae bacterium]
MSARLNKRFAALKAQNRAGLVAYVMACDPDLETSFEILRGLPKAGADVIELGFPFTDPMADGPSVQAAGERALKAGGSLRKALALVERFRAEDQETPIVLMGYANPVFHMGEAAFAAAARKAGVDGAIVVDVPPEEDHDLRAALKGENIALIRFATPTTDDARLVKVLDGASGFLYYVAVAGVTGVKSAPVDTARATIDRLKHASDIPVALGFGVRDPAMARAIAQAADAVVVGSAFVDEIANALADNKPQEAAPRVLAKVKLLGDAIKSARQFEGVSA